MVRPYLCIRWLNSMELHTSTSILSIFDTNSSTEDSTTLVISLWSRLSVSMMHPTKSFFFSS